MDRGLELDLPVFPTLPPADLLDAGQVDGVVAMDSEKSVGREFFEKRAEGANVAETAFGSQANERVVPYRFQEIDVVRVDGHASELGDINKGRDRYGS